MNHSADKDENNLITLLLAEHKKNEKEKEDKRTAQREFNTTELKRLKCFAWITFGVLSFLIIAICICIGFRNEIGISIIGMCIFAGVLGSTSRALLSALDRKSNGWEDKHGNKYPKDEPKDKFSERMFTFFLFRPVFGILAGMLVYFGSDYNSSCDTHNECKMIFFSIVAGLFIKTLIDKLNDLLDMLIKTK